MSFSAPLFASERTAARLLDMKPKQFRELVDRGALPPPVKVMAGIERWDVEDLRAVLRGHKPSNSELDL